MCILALVYVCYVCSLKLCGLLEDVEYEITEPIPNSRIYAGQPNPITPLEQYGMCVYV